MKNILTAMTCILVWSMIMESCVSKRKYALARSRASQITADNIALNNRIKGQQDTINSLHNRLGALGNANENATNQLNKTASELNMTKEQIEAQRARLQQMQSFLEQQHKATEDLKKKVADALIGFKSSELMVSDKNGRIYISMEESLLFPSGSAVVNPRGKEALQKVAGVLNANPDIHIDIEGHTDNKPINTKVYPDNWALSTARATAIARILTNEYGVSPVRLIASGRSYYVPVASNETEAGRAQNRRTEIILEPKYDELMQIMGGTSTMVGK